MISLVFLTSHLIFPWLLWLLLLASHPGLLGLIKFFAAFSVGVSSMTLVTNTQNRKKKKIWERDVPVKRYRNDEYHGCLCTSRKRGALIHRAQPYLVNQTKPLSDGTAFFEHIRLLEGFQPLITSKLNNSKGEKGWCYLQFIFKFSY